MYLSLYTASNLAPIYYLNWCYCVVAWIRTCWILLNRQPQSTPCYGTYGLAVMNLGFGTREYNRRCNHRSPVVTEKILKIIPHILSIKQNGPRGAPLGFYIYLGYLCSSHHSPHKRSKQDKHNTQHKLYYNLINALIKYLWLHFLIIIILAPSLSKLYPKDYIKI